MVKDIRVIEIGEGWAVRREGELTLVSTHDTQQEAEAAAMALAREEGASVLVQGRDGRFTRTKPMGGPKAKPARKQSPPSASRGR